MKTHSLGEKNVTLPDSWHVMHVTPSILIASGDPDAEGAPLFARVHRTQYHVLTTETLRLEYFGRAVGQYNMELGLYIMSAPQGAQYTLFIKDVCYEFTTFDGNYDLTEASDAVAQECLDLAFYNECADRFQRVAYNATSARVGWKVRDLDGLLVSDGVLQHIPDLLADNSPCYVTVNNRQNVTYLSGEGRPALDWSYPEQPPTSIGNLIAYQLPVGTWFSVQGKARYVEEKR